MGTICGADCSKCNMQTACGGCVETDGRPFGKECVVAQCYKVGGEKAYTDFKAETIREFNALGIKDMPTITDLCHLCGGFVNLEYTINGGQKVKFLDDKGIYLGYQVAKDNSDRCYGLVADREYILVSEYGEGGKDAEVVVYKRRAECKKDD